NGSGPHFVDRILRERGRTPSTASFANGIEHCGEAAPSSCLSCRTAVNPSLEAACAPSLARTLRQDRHDEDTADTPAPGREGGCGSSGSEARSLTRRRKLMGRSISAAERF